MVSSDPESESDLNNSIVLSWTIQEQLPDSEAHFLCRDLRSAKACSLADKAVSLESIGDYWYRGKKIDYSLYKATDVSQRKVKTCYLQGSPQILLGRTRMIVSDIHC